MTCHTYRRTSFKDVFVGQEFLWGSYEPENSNWGQKRSSCTADVRTKLLGELSEHKNWCYFRKNETVYVAQ
jgi:hypothetical protein